MPLSKQGLQPPAKPPASPSLLDLPSLALLSVLSRLDLSDLCSAACTCHDLRALAAESPAWRRFYCERWQPPPARLPCVALAASAAGERGVQTGAGVCCQGVVFGRQTHTDRSRAADRTTGPAATRDNSRAEDPRCEPLGGSLSGEQQGREGPPCVQPRSSKGWRQLYLTRHRRSQAFRGRYQGDMLVGHSAGVRSLSLLPPANLIASASHDGRVRLWSLAEGLPLAASPPQGGSLRALALTATHLAVGGTSGCVRVWRAEGGWEEESEEGAEEGAAREEGAQEASRGRDSSCCEAPCCQRTGGGQQEGSNAVEPEAPEERASRRGPGRCPFLFDVAGSWAAAGPPSTRHSAAGCPPSCSDSACALRGAGNPCQRGRRASSSFSLSAHSGPITCLAFGPACDADFTAACPSPLLLFSGSWDASVLCWSLASRQPLRPLFHRDWVWALAPRGNRLFSAAGREVVSWDVEAGVAVRRREGPWLHAGKARAVQASMCGRVVLSGGVDGSVLMMDERVEGMGGSMGAGLVGAWRPGGGEVNCLAFEDPWLVSGGAGGLCALMDVRAAGRGATTLLGPGGVGSKEGGRERSGVRKGSGQQCKEGPQDHALDLKVDRRLGGLHSSVLSVDIGGERVLCGGSDGIVRTFDFSHVSLVHEGPYERGARGRRKGRTRLSSKP